MKWSKQVESYYIDELDYGIYTLLFNTVDKWIPYHRYNNTTYEIGRLSDYSILDYDVKGNLEEFHQSLQECVQEVTDFLPKNKRYIVSHFQEKDQITFVFIPREIFLTKISQIEFLKPKENDTK